LKNLLVNSCFNFNY